MAELNLPTQQSRLRTVAVSAPRSLLSWEDWLTLMPALLTFGAVAFAVQQADLVKRMPPIPVTTMGGLIVGLFMARNRMAAPLAHLLGLLLGTMVVFLVIQDFAEGSTVVDRLADVRLRLWEWWGVVRAGDVSNDNLPFVIVAHGLAMMAAYIAAWSIFRWRNAWLAVIPSGIGILATIAAIDGRPSSAFIVFTLGALLLIARLNLQRRQVQWAKQDIPYPDFMSVAAIQLSTALVVLLVIAAWQVPLGKQADAVDTLVDKVTAPVTDNSDTLMRLFHGVDANRGGNFHKFGSTMAVRGDVALGSKALATVSVRDADIPFIRAASYNEYTGVGWKSSDRTLLEVDANDLPTLGIEQFGARIPLALTVTIVDEEPTLFSAGTPVGANIETLATLPKNHQGDIERLKADGDLSIGDTYVTGGTISVATPAQLNAASTNYPAWVTERYLQLPDDLPDRVRELTTVITQNAETPFEKATAIQLYLRQFPFDFAVPAAPPGRDTTDYFLFDLQRGYFDYSATALTVMLRTQGVPARIAVGYVLDPENQETGDSFIVRKNDAFAWTEVYFNGYGWVNFNASPILPPGGFGGSGTSTAPEVDVEGFEPDIEDLFEDLADLLGPENAQNGDAGSLGSDGGFKPPWTLIFAALGVLAVLAVTGGAASVAWNYQFRGLTGVRRSWAKVQRLGGWTGLEPTAEETASEWSRRLAESTEMSAETKTLSEAYQESRYGRPDLVRVDPEETETAYRSLRGALVAKFFRRKPKSSDAEADEEPEE